MNPDGAGSSFTFTPLPKSFPSLQTTEARDALRKWNLEPYMQAKAFRFDQPFAPERADAFLLDFFGSAAVQAEAPVCTGPGTKAFDGATWSALGEVKPGTIRYARLLTTVLRLDFFDRLREHEIVRGGEICKCLDVQCGEVLASDRLRKLLLDEASDEWTLYSDAERAELIFHVLRRLAIGGGMNQYDDLLEPYTSLTRMLYKDLVSVHKTAGGALQVASTTFAVTEAPGSAASLFPRPSPHNFCYVTVDPVARHAKLWYAAFFPIM